MEWLSPLNHHFGLPPSLLSSLHSYFQFRLLPFLSLSASNLSYLFLFPRQSLSHSQPPLHACGSRHSSHLDMYSPVSSIVSAYRVSSLAMSLCLFISYHPLAIRPRTRVGTDVVHRSLKSTLYYHSIYNKHQALPSSSTCNAYHHTSAHGPRVPATRFTPPINYDHQPGPPSPFQNRFPTATLSCIMLISGMMFTVDAIPWMPHSRTNIHGPIQPSTGPIAWLLHSPV